MIAYIKRYPLSLIVIAIIWYLSFFHSSGNRVKRNSLYRQDGSCMHVWGIVCHAMDRVSVPPPLIDAQTLNYGSCRMSDTDERVHRSPASHLHRNPQWRLDGLCSKLYGGYPRFGFRLLYLQAGNMEV